MEIAQALGAPAAVTNCSTTSGIWALLAGCDAKPPVSASSNK
jgi:hypothetical protein